VYKTFLLVCSNTSYWATTFTVDISLLSFHNDDDDLSIQL